MMAAEQGHAEMAELLLSRGADPTIKDNAGKAAADLASQAALREELVRR